MKNAVSVMLPEKAFKRRSAVPIKKNPEKSRFLNQTKKIKKKKKKKKKNKIKK